MAMIKYTDIFQLNSQKRADSMNYVNSLCNESKSFIMLGQECNVVQGKPSCLNKRHKIIADVNPRAYIYHHKDINSWACPQFTTSDLAATIWVTGNSTGQRIMLASLYWESRVKELPNELVRLAEYCEHEKLPLLIGSDVNCKSVLANCKTTDTRGNKLEAFLAKFNLIVANQGDTWTYFTVKTNSETNVNYEVKSLIDYTMCCNQVDNMISGWHVSLDNNFSDHRTIKMRCNVESSGTIMKYNYQKAKWPVFRSSLQQDMCKFSNDIHWNIQRIEDEANLLHLVIKNAMDKAIPLHKVSVVKPVGWWTKELEQQKLGLNRAYNKFLRHTYNRRLKEEWKMLETAYSRACRKAKRVSWKTFTTGVENAADMAKLNKILKKAPHHQIGMLKKDDGSMCTTPEETLDLVCDKNFPGSLPRKSSREEQDDIRKLSTLKGEFIPASAKFRNHDMIIQSFKSFKANKAAGHDDIKPIVLQNLPPDMVDRIGKIYDACQTIGYTPLVWRQSKVVTPIPKVDSETKKVPYTCHTPLESYGSQLSGNGSIKKIGRANFAGFPI